MAITKIKSLGITDGTIATGDIADDAVTSAKIPNNAIGTTEVTDNAVTTAKITDANVTTAKITNANITTAKLADDAVTQAKIGADAVGTDELSNSLNINTSGFIQTTGAGGLHATHGTAGSQVASIINTTANSNANGVLYVKQTGATNQPTMVIEQTGEGGNSSDTQGLHIKMAGQNQGSGKAIRVTTTNSNLNSGSAYDPFTVTNGGSVTIRDTSNGITSYLDTAGSHTRPKQPGFISIRGSTRLSAANGYSSGVYHTVPFDANGTGNFDTRNNYSTSTERFTFPTTGKYLIGFNLLVYGSNGGYIDFNLMYNSTLLGRAYYDTGTGGNWLPVNFAQIVDASTNDFVWVRAYWTGSQQIHEGSYGNFWGYLLG